jgi:hypothetical protein
MLLYVSDSPPQQYGGLSPNIFVSDSDFSLLRLNEPVEAAKKGCFAGSTFTDERNRTPGWYVEAHIIKRDDIAKSMCDIARGE